MVIFETIVMIMVGIFVSLLLIGLGVVYGAETEKSKCYQELTKTMKEWNKMMPDIVKMYEKMMKMYDEE